MRQFQFILAFVFLGASLMHLGCAPDSPSPTTTSDYIELKGETMGTTYHIQVDTEFLPERVKREVDSVLQVLNSEVSTYIEDATISEFNRAADTFYMTKSDHPHFFRNSLQALRLHDMTSGYYDPSVMPLVNFYGFGYEERKPDQLEDREKVDSLLLFVGLEKLGWREEGDQLWMIKPAAGFQLDFSASAKGDGVDLVSRHLERMGSGNYLVEIGGEVYAKGKNRKGMTWRLGVEVPEEDRTGGYVSKVNLSEKALATSGNYRNYYEHKGKKYSHTIDPKTGEVKRSEILSASVIADDCVTADGLATACMVMGSEKCMNMIEDIPDVEVLIVFSGDEGALKTVQSQEMDNYLMKQEKE